MIKEITLQGILPRVFVNERIPVSEVWSTTLCFRRGEHYLVEAVSGGGKSSMCAYIYGSRDDYEGTLLFNGEDVRRMKMEQWQALRRTNLAYLPQELDLFPELSALENIKLKNSLTGHCSDKEIESRMERLGIAFRRDYPVGKMSIGQQQRVAIIRALCQPFDFIMLDEPVSHLDETNNRIAAEMVMEEARKQGAGIISTSVGNPLLIPEAKRLRL